MTNMSDEIKVVYRDVEITYVEYSNTWSFELRGREKNVPSLQAAKEEIDKPEPEKKKPFVRTEAYMFISEFFDPERLNSFEKVRVTSIADTGVGVRKKMWVIRANGRREQVCASELFIINPSNLEIMHEYHVEAKHINRLRNEQDMRLKSLTRIEIPNE